MRPTSMFAAILAAVVAVLSLSYAVSASSNEPGASKTTDKSPLVALYDCKSGKEVWHTSDAAKTPPIKLASAGFCELHGGDGNYRCEKGSCNGSCKLHNVPVYCSCE